jgi:ABC-2 type transport system permease protein
MKELTKLPKKFYGYLKKDFILFYKRKKYFYLFILFPILLASLFLFFLTPGDYNLKIGVCDLDESQESKMLSDLRNFELTRISIQEDNCKDKLIDQIKQGKYDLGMVIPKGFSENLENLKQSHLEVYYDNTDVAFSNMVSWKVDQSMDPYEKKIIDSLNKKLKNKVSSIRSNVNLILEYNQISGKIGNKIQEINSDLKNVEDMETEFILNPIWTQQVPIYNKNFGKGIGIVFVFPILVLFVILMLSSTSLIYDKKNNFLTRVKSSTSLFWYLLAKTLFFSILAFIQFTIILLMFLAYGAQYDFSILEMFKLVFFIGVVDTLIGLLIGLISDNEGIAVLFSLIISFPLMLVSGIFFPIQTLPKIIQWLANVLPLQYQIEASKAVLLFGNEISMTWSYSSIFLFIVVWWFLRKK